VCIEEEKGLEKTSSPIIEVQTEEFPQKEKEAESTLDTKLLDAPKTEKDSSKNETGSDELEKGAP
jgi:hypothetical protein